MTIPLPNYDQPTDMPDDPHVDCRHEIERLREIIAAIRAKLEDIVCTEPIDRGVVLLSDDGPTHKEVIDGQTVTVYDHEHFSPLGDALIEVWEMTHGT